MEQAQLSLDRATLENYAGAKLSFADRQHGWVVISWQTTTVPFGQMWRTGDGGVTWVKLPRPPTYGRILFDSASHGVLIGGATGDVVYSTADAGQSWSAPGPAPEKVVPALPAAGLAGLPPGSGRNIATRVSFVDAMHGWVEVHNTGDGLSSWILAETEDGGKTYRVLLQGSRMSRR